jgi:dolichol-phosphate mannosyltransferase
MEPAAQNQVTFSFVAPVYNEQEGLELFYNRLSAVAHKLGEPYEIIFVNDGSADKTGDVVRKLSAADAHVRVVEFSRNFGHQLALTAGYDYAAGKAVISLDSDCQHPPELIPQLVNRWKEGFEVVYTVRQDTVGQSPSGRLFGRLVYWVIKFCSGMDLTGQADFRLLDRKALDVIRSAREQARFVRGMVRWIGFKQVAVPYVAEQRKAGKRSYTFKQSALLFIAGVFNFSALPLRLPAIVGAPMFTIAILYAIFSLLFRPFGVVASGAWNIAMLIIGLFGLQFLMLAAIGEYIARIFEEVKGRPLYIVRETIGFKGTGSVP